MHIINDIEAFVKEIENTVYAWFGTGINGENGKDAIKAVIAVHTIPVITGALIPDEQPDAIIEPIIEEVPTVEPVIKEPIIIETSKVEVKNGETNN